jgi:hypothetical protein
MSQSTTPYNNGNWWGDVDEDGTIDDQPPTEIEGTDPAEFIAYQELKTLTDPLCRTQLEEPPWNGGRTAELFAWLDAADADRDARTGDLAAATGADALVDGRGEMLHHEQKPVRLTGPAFYCPKQFERANGTIEEYRQHRHRRRYNPETGYVNWGETTGTAIPQVDYDTYRQAVHNYLARREYLLTREEEYLNLARSLFYSQTQDSHSALATFIRNVRERERD